VVVFSPTRLAPRISCGTRNSTPSPTISACCVTTAAATANPAATPGPYTIETTRRRRRALLDALKLDRVYFCGLSIGRHDRNVSLARHTPRDLHNSFSAIPPRKSAPPGRLERTHHCCATGRMKPFAGAVIDRWLTAAFRAARPGDTAQVLSMLESCNPAGYAASCCAVRDADLPPETRRHPCPNTNHRRVPRPLPPPAR